MKSHRTLALAVAALALGFIAGHGIADEGEGGGGPAGMPTPGEQHAEFKKLEGEWEAQLTYWMAPDAPMKGGTDSCTNKVVFGGWYLDMHYKGTMMGSIPWEGRYTLAYDPRLKEYVGYWISSMSGGPSIGRGQKNDEGALVMTSEAFDTATGKVRPTETVYAWADENTYVMKTYWCSPEKKRENQMMEITYKRKK